MCMFGYEQRITHAVEKILPSVVAIVAAHEAETEQLDPKNALCIPAPESGKTITGGSGIVIGDNFIVTNKHVVLDPNALYAVFDQNGNRYDASVVARDPIKDIAILCMNAKSPNTLPIAPLGTSRELKLGQTVIAIGNALGEFRSTVSAGIISGLSRFVTAVTDGNGHQERLRGLIQTDAAINSGNSGGPLIDSSGKVVGINTAVIAGAQNIGFAIPIDQILRDIRDVKRHGHIARPFLGIRYVLIDPLLQKRYALPVDYGALVVREQIPGDEAVITKSPAANAEIQEGDILLLFDGKKISKQQTIEDMLEYHEPNDTVEIQILRDDKKSAKNIVLDAWAN